MDLFEGDSLETAKPMARTQVKLGQIYESNEQVVVMLVVPS